MVAGRGEHTGKSRQRRWRWQGWCLPKVRTQRRDHKIDGGRISEELLWDVAPSLPNGGEQLSIVFYGVQVAARRDDMWGRNSAYDERDGWRQASCPQCVGHLHRQNTAQAVAQQDVRQVQLRRQAANNLVDDDREISNGRLLHSMSAAWKGDGVGLEAGRGHGRSPATERVQ